MDQIPKETETIAKKRSLRLAEKISRARQKIKISNVWWNSFPFEVSMVLFVFILNLYLFSGYFIKPNINTTFYSGPIIPFFAKLVTFFGFTINHSLQIVNALFAALLPVVLYFFIKSITERKIIGLLTVLMISLPFYPFLNTRVMLSLNGVDGAHISSLIFSILALLGLFDFLRFGGSINLIMASIFSSLVALTSPFGFSTFLIFAFILTFSEMLLGNGRLKFFRVLLVLVFSACLTAFWYNPHFTYWLLTGELGEEVRRTFSKLLPISFFAIPGLAAFGYLLFDRKPNLQPVFLASFFTIAFATISLAGGGIFPSHPSRYVPEFGISVAFLLSVLVVKILERTPFFVNNKKYVRITVAVLIGILLIACFVAKPLLYPNVDVLGLWTGVERGAVWQARDNFNGAGDVFGFAITATATLILSTIYVRSSRELSKQ